MESFYKVINKSRQQYWQIQKREERKEEEEEKIVDAVLKCRLDHPRMGSRVLYHALRNKGIELGVGINKFESIVKNNGLLVGKAKSPKPKGSDGKGKGRYVNKANGIKLNDINQLIVGDITYFEVERAWHYIFTLKDVYSQKVLGLYPSKTMRKEDALKCLEQAVKRRGAEKLHGCIHHTDNGSQYDSKLIVERLKEIGMKISRARSWQENGSAEQVNHIVKNMYFEGWHVETFKDLKAACKRYIKLNNTERPIKQLGYMTPDEFEKWIERMEEIDRPEKELHNFDKKKD
jgi:transposase InsO family protein